MTPRISNGIAWAVVPVLLLAFAAVALWQRRHPPPEIVLPAPLMQHEPSLMLWAWETPEDLTALDPAQTGVAFLSREVLLGNALVVRPRRQPLRVAPGTWLMAVVRIEAAPGFVASKELAASAAKAIAAAAAEPNVRAVQVDFDATASQRDFYAEVLRRVRRELPASEPLSITALVSWCGPHSWLRVFAPNDIDREIDEAVPMFFRMGGPSATRAAAPRSQQVIAEPLCAGSVGVSTDEAWPPIHSGQRVYVFRSGAWTAADLARIRTFGYQGLRQSPTQDSRQVPQP